MTAPQPKPIIPRGLLIGVGVVLCLAMTTAGLARHRDRDTTEPSVAVASRDLRFEDRADRGVDIRDTATGSIIETVPPKSGGFLRGVMRALLYDYRSGARRLDGVGPHAFRLTQWADGRLSLKDPTTGDRIELEAFGSTNRDVFAKLLEIPDHHVPGSP